MRDETQGSIRLGIVEGVSEAPDLAHGMGLHDRESLVRLDWRAVSFAQALEDLLARLAQDRVAVEAFDDLGDHALRA